MRKARKPLTGILILAFWSQSFLVPSASGAEPFYKTFNLIIRRPSQALLGRHKPPTDKDDSVQILAHEIDWLEHHVDAFGTIVTKDMEKNKPEARRPILSSLCRRVLGGKSSACRRMDNLLSRFKNGLARTRILEEVESSIFGAAEKVRDAVAIEIDGGRAHVVSFDILPGKRCGVLQSPGSVLLARSTIEVRAGRVQQEIELPVAVPVDDA
jgi:hypothetical protein